MTGQIHDFYTTHKLILEENFRQTLDKFEMDAIHKMRTSSKRLRALFLLIQFLSGNDFNARKQLKKVRQMFKHAGKIREIQIEEQIVLKYAEKLAESYPEYLEYLKRREHKEIVRFLENLPPVQERFLILNDDRILKAIANIENGNLPESMQAFTAHLADKLRENMARPLSNHRIHQNRTILKQIYYLYDLIVNLSGNREPFRFDAERAREIEQYIGVWHDLVNSPVYLNGFLATNQSVSKNKYKQLKTIIAAERKEMRIVIRKYIYPALIS